MRVNDDFEVPDDFPYPSIFIYCAGWWPSWKTLEVVLESGPQLILQIYIMTLPQGILP